MRVKVRMLGVLKKILGKDELFFDLDVSGELRLRNIIERILAEDVSLKDILLDPDLKDPRPNTIVLINGKEIGLLGGLDEIVRDGDEIILIPVVHGG